MKEKTDIYKSMSASLAIPDEHSMGVFKMLQDVYPAFSAKLFQGNELMQILVMSGNNPMEILDYPICGRCETLAPYNGIGIKNGRRVLKCTCMAEKCGATTLEPVTLREWIRDELKKKVKEDWYEVIEVALDQIAMTMVMKHASEQRQIMERRNGTAKPVGIILPDGSEHLIGNLVEHCGTNIPEENKYFEGGK